MPDNPFTDERARRQNPFTAERERRTVQPSVPFGVAAPGSAPAGPPLLGIKELGPKLVEAFDPISQGLTFGFSDEITAPFTAMITGETTEEALQRTRDRSARISEDLGPSATVLEVGGAVLPAAVAGPAAFAALPARIPAIAKLGILGAAEGALAGAGTAEGGISERAQGAVEGGAIGGAIGVAAPLTAQAVLRFGRGIINRFGGAQRRAATQVLRALERDEIAPEDALRRLDELGGDASIIDAGGENTLGLARATQSIPGQGKSRIANMLNVRQEGQGTRLTGIARRALGAPDDFSGSLDDLITARKAAAKPAYDAAYAQEVPFTDDMQRLFKRPAIAQAWERAKQIAANEDVVLPEVFDEAGEFVTAPNMQTIDFIKRGLDDIVERSRNQITGAIEGDLARGVAASRRALLEVVDELNPLYPTARASFAGPSRSIDALRQGRRLAASLNRQGNEQFDPATILRDLDRMNDAEKQFFRSGLAQGVQDVIERTPDGGNAVRRVVGTKAMRDRLRAAFESEEDFNRFLLAMEGEARLFESRAAVTGNSVTGRLEAEQADLLSDAGGTLANVSLGRFNEVRDSAVRRLLDRAVSGPRNANLSSALADLLTAQGPAAQSTLTQIAAPPTIPPALQRTAIAGLLAGAQQGGF